MLCFIMLYIFVCVLCMLVQYWPLLFPDETQLYLEAKESYKSQSYK